MEKNKITGFIDLEVWMKAHRNTWSIDVITEHFPGKGQYGIFNQIRRAAISIPSNVVEGKGRNKTKDYVRFLFVPEVLRKNLNTCFFCAGNYPIFLQKDSININRVAGKV